jgi:hypothetical protein
MTFQDFKNKTFTFLNNMTTEQVKEMANILTFDTRPESNMVLEAVLLWLEERMDEQSYIEFCDSLI